MTNLYIFNYLNSQRDECPDFFEPWFCQAIAFARSILRHRSEIEIAEAMRSIDEYIVKNAGGFPITTLHFQKEQPDFTLEHFGPPVGRLGTITLLDLKRRNGKPPFNGIMEPTWAEIFSIYALGQVAYANRDIRHMESHDDFNKTELLLELSGEYLAVVTELSTIAQILCSNSGLIGEATLRQNDVNNKFSIAARGGQAKSAKYASLRREVLNRYVEKHAHKSNRYAAKLIWQELPPGSKLGADGCVLISEYNAEDTLAKWIAQFKRLSKE